MSTFELTAVFMTIIALVGWLNVNFFRFPTATAMVLAGLAAGGLMVAARYFVPTPNAASDLVQAIENLNFPQAVLGYLLAFLLFAGAMQVNLAELRKRIFVVLSLATIGILVSTVVVGLGLWLVAGKLGLALTLPWAFVFGTLISPTDPIAVLAAVRTGNFPAALQAVLQGEALFNDGVGIVLFTAAIAFAAGGGSLHPAGTLFHVGIEALGGLALGWVAALATIRLMHSVNDYGVEVALTIALATGVYALAQAIHVSGPIAVVVAGLLVGEKEARTAMSEATQSHVRSFWMLVDEILNAILFLLLGLELLVISFDVRLVGFWIVAVMLVLLARTLVVFPWGTYFDLRTGSRGASLVLSWGGLHGALSLALALTLPRGEARALILSTTFAVVIFSVLVQGLTFGRLAARISRGRSTTLFQEK